MKIWLEIRPKWYKYTLFICKQKFLPNFTIVKFYMSLRVRKISYWLNTKLLTNLSICVQPQPCENCSANFLQHIDLALRLGNITLGMHRMWKKMCPLKKAHNIKIQAHKCVKFGLYSHTWRKRPINRYASHNIFITISSALTEFHKFVRCMGLVPTNLCSVELLVGLWQSIRANIGCIPCMFTINKNKHWYTKTFNMTSWEK